MAKLNVSLLRNRNILINLQLLNIALRLSAGFTMTFTKKYVRNKKIIHTVGHRNSAVITLV